MSTGSKVVGTISALLIAALGGYVALDYVDIAPGFITGAPPAPTAQPFPTTAAQSLTATSVERWTGADPTAPEPDEAAISSAVSAAATDATRLGDQVGILVMDAITGQVLGSSAPSTPMTPASTLKLLTALAAAHSLDLTATLDTVAVFDGAGTVTLVGGGDMMLAAGAGDPTAVAGRAGLADLADATVKELRLMGYTSVQVRVDDTLFDPDGTSAWDPSTPDQGWAAPVAALAVDIGRVAEGEYAPRSHDPAADAGQTFATLLAARGVAVSGSVTRAPAPADATELARVTSAPIEDVVGYALEHSDNTITEVVGRLVAVQRGLPATFAGATAAVAATVREQGIDITGLVMTDCSGLGDGSLAPAQLIASVAAALVTASDPLTRSVAQGLPISALTGTLSDRFVGTSLAGQVRAKTGGLEGVASLAGSLMTSGQRQLVFAIVADHTPPAPWAAKAAIDDFVLAVGAS